MSNIKEQATLYFREGASDKTYQICLEEKDGGFVVNFAFGRRGSTMQTGSKTLEPVTRAKATLIYAKLIREKMAKGYTLGPEGTPYSQGEKADRITGVSCQLLNAIDEPEVERLIHDAAFCAQEKKDGCRVLVRHTDGAITGINRKGLSIGLPAPIEIQASAIASVAGDFILDGECIGNTLYAFDLLTFKGVDLRLEPYAMRMDELSKIVGIASRSAIQIVETARSTAEKRSLFKLLQDQRREGLVFKQHFAPYFAGRPNSGGSQLKFKFYATASLVVSKANKSKRSVAVHVLNGNTPVDVGNVTIPPKRPIPAAGSIIDARYLYAYPGGSLYQPIFLGSRTDIDSSACTIAQLKLRAAEEDDDSL